MKNTVLIYFPDTGGHNFTPPYEMLFQINALKNAGVEILICDSRNQSFIDIFTKNKKRIFLIIISTIIKYTSITITHQYIDGVDICLYIKKNSTIPIVWTGLAANVMTEQLVSNPNIDLIIKGNSDNKLNQLIQNLKSNKTYKDIPSLIYKTNNNTQYNSEDDYQNSFLDYGNFCFDNISLKDFIHNNTFDYIASTGCVNSCSFCSVPLIYKRKWQHNSIDNIVYHFKYLFNNLPELRIIHFRDDNFLINKTFVFNLLKSLKEEGINFHWSAQTSVNILNNYSDNDLNMIYNNGCRNISIGIESGDEYILKKVTKNKTTKQDSLRTIKRILNANITPSVTSIISFPYNKGRDFNKTLKFLMKIKNTHPALSLYCTIFQPIPQTEIFLEIFSNKEWKGTVLSNNTWTSKHKIKKLKKFEEFYFIFNDKNFYKKIHSNLSKDVKLINKIFAPFIKLRFHLQCTSFLWEYALISNKLRRIKTKHKINQDTSMSDIGIRHLNSNYNYGFIEKSEE